MDDLEQQLVDLQETVELLTLDKEQLTLDKELLEEQLQQAQDEIAALRASSASAITPPPVPGQADEVELRRLQDENAKLRDAVRKLHDLHEEAKQTLEEQKLELDIYSSELEELRAYKEQATAEIDELKQTVDSMSSFESMIEKLTNDNLDLSSSLADAKQTIQELEDAIEVNEELDQQQRDQIDADRKTIDSLQVSLHNLELIMQEKDSNLHDVQKKLDAMRQKYYGEKQEVEKLQQSLSLGSQDHKEIEATLRENSVLRRQTEDLYLESWLLRGQLSNANLQRLRFQALYTRLNDYFGSTSYFMEENKLLNMEILGISTLSSGFEAGKQLSLLLGMFYQRGSVVDAPQEQVTKIDMIATTSALLTSAFHLIVPLQAALIRTILPRIRDQSRKVLNDVSSHQESVQAMQQLQTVKAVYDALLQQISKFALPIRKLMIDLTSCPVQEQASLERQSDFIYVKTEVVPALTTLVETLKTSLLVVVGNGVYDSQDANSVDTISSVLEQGLLAILPPSGASGSSMAHATMDTNDSDPSTPTASTVDGQTNESQYLERELSVETLYLMFSSLLESVCYQSETSNWSTAMSNQVLDTLRSIRIELEECVRVSYKTYTRLASQPKYYRTLLNAMIELVRLFRATEPAQMVLLPFTTEEVHPSFKQVLTTLRSLRSDIANSLGTAASNTSSTASSASSAFDQSSTVALRYFPAIFLLTRSASTTTSSSSASSTSYGNNESSTHSTMHVEQVAYLIERYWSLLLQGENELLVSAQTLSQHKGLTNADVMAWKERVHHFRSVILSKLDMSPSGIASQGSSEGGLFSEDGGQSRSPFRSAANAESAGELKLWKRKVDMKDEELRQAMKQVTSLQEAKDALQQELTAALAAAAAAPSTSKEATATGDSSSDDPVVTIRRLQEEIKALEEAVESLDKRYEDVVRENKALKAGSGGSGRPPLAGGASASTGASATSSSAAGGSHHPKMPRTKTSLDLFEATKALVAGATSGSGGASTPNPSALSINPLASVTSNSTAASRAPSPHVSSRAMTPTPGSSGSSSFSFTSKASAVASADQAILGGCTPFEQHLLEQLKQWKRIALRRLTQSLRPLPEKRLRTTTSDNTGNQLSETANAVVLTDSALEIAIPKTQASPAGDCLAAYRALRLARVTQARLSTAEDVSISSASYSRKPRRVEGPPSTLGHILYRLHKLPGSTASISSQ